MSSGKGFLEDCFIGYLLELLIGKLEQPMNLPSCKNDKAKAFSSFRKVAVLEAMGLKTRNFLSVFGFAHRPPDDLEAGVHGKPA